VKNWGQLEQIDWKREYEEMRRQAFQTSPGGHGLALFLSRGMMAWLEALRALTSRRIAPIISSESMDVPSVVRSDLTTLLANMVLSCVKREMHEPIQ